LGCGGPGGNITSDNISPRHLLNLKRLAYELRPAVASAQPSTQPVAAESRPKPAVGAVPLPQAPSRPMAQGISAQTLATKIDTFLASRGYRPPDDAPVPSSEAAIAEKPARADKPAEFICEDDVRAALRAGRKLLVGGRTIITPAARDLGESQKVFQQAGWPH
jgi:acetaldehyde dehydrogenase (acetylating)